MELSPRQRTNLLFAYIPFFVIPLLITFDIGARVSRLAAAGIRVQVFILSVLTYSFD
jgi:hypothetical protein